LGYGEINLFCLTVTYPNSEGSHFDQDYYVEKHLALCAELFAAHGFRGSVVKFGQGKSPGQAGLNHASVDLLFDSQEQMQAGLAAGGKQIVADVANYTNIKPQMSFAEVLLALDCSPSKPGSVSS
jgi:uncharacterized protein (TIGR02118 family)